MVLIHFVRAPTIALRTLRFPAQQLRLLAAMLDRPEKLRIESHQAGQHLGVHLVVLQRALRNQPHPTRTAHDNLMTE